MAKSEDDDLLAEAKDLFQKASDAENDNRQRALDDIAFARLGEQWPEHIKAEREIERRPCLTINKLPAFIRQVVNDSRQNKPSIKCHPVDSGADKETAAILDGLIRNIEYASDADVAYDTAIECAVSGGFGYLRVVLDYAYDDSFDMDIAIRRVANPFSVYGDPASSAADSSDWNTAFVVDRLRRDEYQATYHKDEKVDWDDNAWSGLTNTDWCEDDYVMVAEFWRREQVDRKILLFTDAKGGRFVYAEDDFKADPDLQMLAQNGVIQFQQERMGKGHKVKQYKLSGAEVLSEYDWPGRFIPIVPVYGEEFDVQGKRYFRSMIHDAKDAQQMYNFWRTNAAELVALAPRTPFIGPVGAFSTDIDKWQTANSKNHPFIEYDPVAIAGNVPPQRQPLDVGAAAGSLQEALNASDDIKAILGLHDASLGARSNETSGRAILARQREGDVSTFNFIDNLSRAIRHTGRIILDLVPHVYDAPRIIRVIGEDGKQSEAPVNQQVPQQDQDGNQILGPNGEVLTAIHDLTAGKYDVTVKSGPSFTTRREEAAASMTEALRAFPQGAPVILPELAKNLDWPGADEIAQKLEQQASGQVPPQVQKQMQEVQQQIQQLTEENQKLKQDKSDKIAEIEADKQIAAVKVASEKEIAFAKIDAEQQIDAYKAQLTAQAQAARPVIQNVRPNAA